MSQERTRFPIQPQDRHRTAKSTERIKSEPEEMGKEQAARRRPQDKPQIPPHRRHEDRSESERSGDAEAGADED